MQYSIFGNRHLTAVAGLDTVTRLPGGVEMVTRATWMLTLLIASLLIVPARTASHGVLPVEPELTTRLDELYDHEARLFIMLYSLKGDGQVDYVTGRSVQEYARSNYGNPMYRTDEYPLFYWWDHTMWNDPEQDGVNGNERVYQENVDFDILRYKPCAFNGQPC